MPRTTRLVRKMAALVAFAASLCAQVDPQSALDRYCLACHNSTVSSGGIALDRSTAAAPGADPQLWESVVGKLTHRHMPPRGMPRPDEATYDALVRELSQRLDAHAAAHSQRGP